MGLTLQPVGGALYAPTPVVLCLLLKKALDNPYLKILDIPQLFVADAPIKNSFTPYLLFTTPS